MGSDSSQGSLDPNFPDLPFTVEELTRAYERFVPTDEARACAERLRDLPQQMRLEARNREQEGPEAAGSIAYLVIKDEIFASLALESAELRARVAAFMAERWVATERSLAQAHRRMRRIPEDAPLPDRVQARIEEDVAGLKESWRNCLERVKSGEASLD